MPPARHVVVTADQTLMADTISAALSSTDLATTRRPWHPEPGVRVPAAREAEPVDAGVLISDLQPLVRLVEAERAIRALPVPWVVLTAAEPGPLWGAVLEAGAVAVLRSSCTLEELRTAVDLVVRGQPLHPPAEVAELVSSWRAVQGGQAMSRVRSLSPREAEVLGLMHAGWSVARIATRFGVSEATVRSQVRAVLRKLDVGSQLAAVAAYHAASEEIDGSHPSP